jgi:hypothetical protein
MSDNSAFLLYVSADGARLPPDARSEKGECQACGEPSNWELLGYQGGIALNPRRHLEPETADMTVLINTFHPEDLIPFTRRPFFLIIESNNSTAFNVRYRNELLYSLLSLLCLGHTKRVSSAHGLPHVTHRVPFHA